MTLHVELVSPESSVWSGDVVSVLLRTLGGGDIQFLTGHTPFLGALDICTVTMRLPDGLLEKCAVRGGFVEVSDNNVKILTDAAELPAMIDPDEASAARTAAEEALQRAQDDDEAAAEAKWHSVRLDTAGAT